MMWWSVLIVSFMLYIRSMRFCVAYVLLHWVNAAQLSIFCFILVR